jgi:hypothetical protein
MAKTRFATLPNSFMVTNENSAAEIDKIISAEIPKTEILYFMI